MNITPKPIFYIIPMIQRNFKNLTFIKASFWVRVPVLWDFIGQFCLMLSFASTAVAKLRSTNISTGKDVEQEELLFTEVSMKNLERFGRQFRNFLQNYPYPYHSVQFSSVAQLCPTLCDSRDCSMPGLSVYHQLPEFTQTHVHWVGDAIQPSHPLSSPSPPAFNLSQHQGLYCMSYQLHYLIFTQWR